MTDSQNFPENQNSPENPDLPEDENLPGSATPEDPAEQAFDAGPSAPSDPFAPPGAEPRPRRRRAASRPTGAAASSPFTVPTPEPVLPAEPAVEADAVVPDAAAGSDQLAPADEPTDEELEAAAALALDASGAEPATPETPAEPTVQAFEEGSSSTASRPSRRAARRPAAAPPVVTFQAPDLSELPPRPAPQSVLDEDDDESSADDADGSGPSDDGADSASDDAEGGRSRRRRRGRRGRGRPRDEDESSGDDEGGADETGSSADSRSDSKAEKAEKADKADSAAGTPDAAGDSDDEAAESGGGSKRRRRRRRRGEGDSDEGGSAGTSSNGSSNGSSSSSVEDEIKGVSGSTRLEAKRQRRRDNRDSSRRRVPIVTEAEYLARREAVDRVMVVRNAGDRTQIAVLEDNVLVEHYVTRASSSSYAGNVYLGKVQNVLPSMEAAFVDIGKGRNGVLYAGEVNYDASGLEGKPRKIEQALKSGQSVVVQVTKDPIGHKGARLTSQISLPGRYMVYVPEGGSAGISRKLPDTERARLRSILKKITPEDAGVIVRTAAEGASEEELSRDISRLSTQWEQIQKKATKASAPALLSAEPDLVVRVVRDIFNEDFRELVVQGDGEWSTIQSYVDSVAPDLLPRLRKHIDSEDVFDSYRIDEQLLKALDRKVYLPSGGSLVFDRTEAMTVVDVNTGKFTGKGGNLEETVTRNNLEAAEELVRQLRLRDIGGIIVTDFIDMVLESNRELVLRRLTECLGRDRTKHQVAEVTSLGLVQMTRKRVGQGLLEAYSEPCPACGGKGVHIELPSAGGTSAGSGGSNGGSTAGKGSSKPIPRPPTTRPIPLPPEPKANGTESGGADSDDVATEGAELSGADAPETAVPTDDAALDGAAEGSVESTTDFPTSRPSADEVEVEAASASIPDDVDVEADSPAARQASAVETATELPTAEEAAEPAPAPVEATTPRPRRAGRRRSARTSPITAVLPEENGAPAANGGGGSPSGESLSGGAPSGEGPSSESSSNEAPSNQSSAPTEGDGPGSDPVSSLS